MAVTYSWRLDANKYAYIVSPEKMNGTSQEKDFYGYATEYPVTGTDLTTIAQRANEWFGENGKFGITGYTEAYNAMLGKINEKFKDDTSFYDLLSADVYYNVDSNQCADLRGVGIKGIKYLGASEKYDPQAPSWNPNIQQNDTEKLSGKFSIYGVYMSDQDIDTATPETIFAVYNGIDGRTPLIPIEIANVAAAVVKEAKDREDADDVINGRLKTLEDEVASLDGIENGDINSVIEAKVAAKTAELTETIENLQEQLNNLRKELEKIKETPNGDGGNSSAADIQYSEYVSGTVYLVGKKDNDDNLYYISGLTYDNGKLKSDEFFEN
jgi:hypothetical protein